MPRRPEMPSLSADERRREVAAILARGVFRLRQINQTGGFTHAPKSLPDRQNGLELSGETRLSVSDGTRGLRLRDDGDDA